MARKRQSISIDGKFNTGARFPLKQHTKVEHPSMNQDHIKIRRMTSEVLNTATPTKSANLYSRPKVKPERSKAVANINKIQFTDGLHNAQYTDHLDTSNNITTPDMAGVWLKEEKSKQENPVIDKNNSSEDGKEIMPDKNEQYPLPCDTDDHYTGPNDGHQGMHETTPGHVKIEPAPTTTTSARGEEKMIESCYVTHITCQITKPNVRSAPRADSTRHYSPARPPEDVPGEPAPEWPSVTLVRSLTATMGKTATTYRAVPRRPNINGTYNANGKTMPLLKHTFDTHSTKPAQKSDPTSCARSLSSQPMPLHLYKVGLVPMPDCTGGNSPAIPLQPLSTITHSKESTCLTTTCNPSKLLKPRRMFKPHHAKMASVLLQLHGEPGIITLVRTDANNKRAGAQHRQCIANLPCYYVDIGAAAQPQKIRFFCRLSCANNIHAVPYNRYLRRHPTITPPNRRPGQDGQRHEPQLVP